jgi:hypothetical protein
MLPVNKFYGCVGIISSFWITRNFILPPRVIELKSTCGGDKVMGHSIFSVLGFYTSAEIWHDTDVGCFPVNYGSFRRASYVIVHEPCADKNCKNESREQIYP